MLFCHVRGLWLSSPESGLFFSFFNMYLNNKIINLKEINFIHSVMDHAFDIVLKMISPNPKSCRYSTFLRKFKCSFDYMCDSFCDNYYSGKKMFVPKFNFECECPLSPTWPFLVYVVFSPLLKINWVQLHVYFRGFCSLLLIYLSAIFAKTIVPDYYSSILYLKFNLASFPTLSFVFSIGTAFWNCYLSI